MLNNFLNIILLSLREKEKPILGFVTVKEKDGIDITERVDPYPNWTQKTECMHQFFFGGKIGIWYTFRCKLCDTVKWSNEMSAETNAEGA